MKPVSKYIFLRLLLPMTAGIVVGHECDLPDASSYWTAGIVIFLLAAIFVVHINYIRLELYLMPWLSGVLFQIFIFSLACIHTSSYLLCNKDEHFSRQPATRFLVEICSEPLRSARTTRYEALVLSAFYSGEQASSEGKLLVSQLNEVKEVRNPSIGDRLIIPAGFSEIPGPQNPGEFDYRRYMANKGIWHQAYLTTADAVCVGKAGWNLVYAAVRLRKTIVSKLDKYIDDPEASAIISTLLLGYKADLSNEILKTYSATGVMHVLSVSGMHVAIVAALAGYLLGFWKGRKMNMIQALLIVAFVWLYTLLSGLSAAACRSAITVSFVIGARLWNKDSEMLNCVCAAAFYQLLFKPQWLFDIGFQLSYLAVFGLVILYPPVKKFLTFRSRYWSALWSYISFSLAAQLATFPICLYYFNQFPLYFLASNILIMLPVTVVMYSGVGFLLLVFLPSSADIPLRFLAFVMENGIHVMNECLRIIEKLPLSNIHGYHFNFGFYSLFYLLIATCYIAFTGRRKWAVWCAILLMLSIVVVYSISGLLIWRRKSVVFYAVRNHVAIAFIRGGVATIITDLRTEDKAWSYSVLPLIQNRNLELDKPVSISSRLTDKDLKMCSGRIRFLHLKLKILEKSSLLLRRRWDKQSVRYKLTPGNLPGIQESIMLLHDNPDVNIAELLYDDNIKQIIIGTKNSRYNISKWQRQADSLRIFCHTLSEEGAFEMEVKDLN